MLERCRCLAKIVVVTCATATSGAADELPPVGCLEALRKARVEESAGALAAARQRTEAAVALPGCELPALAELLRLLQTGAYPEANAAELRQRLAARIEDPKSVLPRGILFHLAALRTTREQDELLLAALERRLAASSREVPAAETGSAREALVELLTVTIEMQERMGRLGPARDNLGRLMALEGAQRWRWQAIELDRRLERWESLATTLEEMLRAPSAPAHLTWLYVTTLARLGRYEEMLRIVDRIAPQPPATATDAPAGDGETPERMPDPLVGLLVETGWTLRDARRDEQAEAMFRRALALDPTSESARAVLLHVYGSAEERAAHAAAVAARRESEENPNALFDEGSQLLAAGDAANAIELLARAAPALEGSVFAEAAWFNLGLAAHKLERWPQAAEAFARAAALNPARPNTHYQHGMALLRADRCAEAVAPLRRALELNPAKFDVHYFLGSCYEKLGDAAAAAREHELYRRAKPRD